MSSRENFQPENIESKSPPESPPDPDADTRKGPGFDQGGRPGQVFHFRKFGISYGTDDKGHAAAIILSVLTLISLIILFIIGSIFDRDWIGDALKILGTTFTLVTGIAVGKSSHKDG